MEQQRKETIGGRGRLPDLTLTTDTG